MLLSSKIQDVASSLLSSGKNIDANIFYSALFDSLSLSEIQEKIYFDYGDELFKDLQKELFHMQREDFLPLFLDPRIATRWKQFCSFVEEGSFSSPYEAKDAFFASASKKKYFRALVLTEKQYKEIQKQGFICNALRNSSEIFLQTFSLSLQSRLKIHAHEYVRTDASSYISFSAFPELAKYLTHRFFFQSHSEKTLSSAKKEGYFVYLFPVTLLEFDFFSFGIAFQIDEKYRKSYLVSETNSIIPFENAEHWREFSLAPEYIDFVNVKKTPLGEVQEFTMLSL